MQFSLALGFYSKGAILRSKRFSIKETRCDEIILRKFLAVIDEVEDVWKKEGIWNVDEKKRAYNF